MDGSYDIYADSGELSLGIWVWGSGFGALGFGRWVSGSWVRGAGSGVLGTDTATASRHRLGLGFHATDLTTPPTSRVRRQRAVDTSHTRTLPSSEPDRTAMKTAMNTTGNNDDYTVY